MDIDYKEEIIKLRKIMADTVSFAKKDKLTESLVPLLADYTTFTKEYTEENYKEYFESVKSVVSDITKIDVDNLQSPNHIYRCMLVSLLTRQIVGNSGVAKDTMNTLMDIFTANRNLIETHLNNARIAALISACARFDDHQSEKLFYALKIITIEAVGDDNYTKDAVGVKNIKGVFALLESYLVELKKEVELKNHEQLEKEMLEKGSLLTPEKEIDKSFIVGGDK
jgi:hypothetical protein